MLNCFLAENFELAGLRGPIFTTSLVEILYIMHLFMKPELLFKTLLTFLEIKNRNFLARPRYY